MKLEITTKAEAIAFLSLLQQDIGMLKSGEWVPDAASCDAALEVIDALKKYLEN